MSIRRPEMTPELKTVIDEVLIELQGLRSDSEEYDTILKKLERLYKLKDADRRKQVDPNTVLVVSANLIGIGMILGYEHAHVVTSKALGFIMKAR